MSTIKEIIQNFCYRKNLPAPTSFVGVSSQTERQYLSLFQYIGDMLRNKPVLWPQLKRPYTFTTSTGVTDYRLPGDFYKLLPANQWDQTNQWPLAGSLSDAAFVERDLAIVSTSTRKAFRVTGATQYLFSTSPYSKRSAGTFQIDPAGDNNTDTLFLGYISCNWIWPRDWVANTVYSAGAIRSGDGYIYRTTAGGTSGATRPSGSTSPASDGTITDWVLYREPYLCNPANTDLNDNDLCLFDEDIMIEGMNWAYLKEKKLDYAQERLDWENAVKAACSRFNGPARCNMNDYCDDEEDFPRSPEGSWSV